MNQVTQYILGIYQINMIIRDTVSYVAPRKEQSFSKEIYEHRGRSLELLTAEGSPFAHFVSINKEKADKLVENINEFKKEMYSPESRVFRVVGEGIEVDDKMHHRVYEMAIGIYQTLLDVLGGYIKYAKDNDQLELRIEELVAADEYFFRSLSYFALINDIFKLFKEFSDAMQQHKGEPNPIAKFINEDINKMVQLIDVYKRQGMNGAYTIVDGQIRDEHFLDFPIEKMLYDLNALFPILGTMLISQKYPLLISTPPIGKFIQFFYNVYYFLQGRYAEEMCIRDSLRGIREAWWRCF